MSRVVVFMNLTLDGVMQAPGRADEDPRGGFQYGGWAAPYAAMSSSEAGESVPNFGALLLGRRTYEGLYDYWPKQVGNPMTEMLNNIRSTLFQRRCRSRYHGSIQPYLKATCRERWLSSKSSRMKT